jgi:hypothetical protein
MEDLEPAAGLAPGFESFGSPSNFTDVLVLVLPCSLDETVESQ